LTHAQTQARTNLNSDPLYKFSGHETNDCVFHRRAVRYGISQR
jgi:hypothetical protein